MPFIKFNTDGKWMDVLGKPNIKVEAGKTYPVSQRLAKLAIENNRGELVLEKPEDLSAPSTEDTPEEKALEALKAQEALDAQADLEYQERKAQEEKAELEAAQKKQDDEAKIKKAEEQVKKDAEEKRIQDAAKKADAGLAKAVNKKRR